MNTYTSGAPADGGEPIVDNVQDETTQAPETEQAQETRQLSVEEYEQRDRQKTAALREERAKARAYQRELDNFRREIYAMRQSGNHAQANRMDDQLEDIPDPEQNPMAALNALAKMARNLNSQQREMTVAEKRQQEEAEQIQSLQSFVTEAENDFRQDHPDYDDACKHLRQALRDEYEDQGLRGEKLQRAMYSELVRLADTARQNGSDPAEVYWRVAVRRGYQAKSGERQVEQIKRGQEHDVRVPRGGGKNNNFSRDALLNANRDDFDKMWKIYEQQARGGRS